MKPLDRQSEVVFRKLTEGLDTVGDCRKIDGSINVKVVERTKLGPLILITRLRNGSDNAPARHVGITLLISSIGAITGNLVQDTDDRIYPISYRRNGWNQESLVLRHERWHVYPELQITICRFAEQWMLEISEQHNP